MSAIAGIFNVDGAPVFPDQVRAMTDVVMHRGPDGISDWVKGPVGLGHLHLATTPEALMERAPQLFDGGESALVWDGRLDNREEMADRLRLRMRLAELTDADLVVSAYREWGTGAFERLLGDFALAIWDGKRQELVCARDPIGVRPFHYHFDGHRFIFGTEIKQIFQDRAVPRDLNETMLGLALCGGWGSPEMTFYRRVMRLPGGYWMAVSSKGVRTQAFWNPDPDQAMEFRKPEQYAERFRKIIVDAVHARLRSVNGAEIKLSGGVDSSAVASVAGLLQQNGSVPGPSVSALSCVYGYADLDESPYVRAVADRYQIPVTWVPVDDQWAMKRLSAAALQDEPFQLHFEGIQQAALESAQSRGLKVLLTGEGGDETSMYGYMLHTRDSFRRLRWLSIWRDLRGGTPGYRRAGLNAVRHALVPGWVQRWHGRDGASIPSWVRPEFVAKADLRSQVWDLEPRSRKESLYLQMRGRLQLFLGSDVRGAAYGIEYRHPLWDARVVEFLSRIPPQVRFEGGREKLLLRRAMAGILPDEIRRRAGHGAFGTLVDRGLKQEEASRIREALTHSRLAELGVIDAKMLRETFDAYVAGDEAKRARVMPTLLVEDWLSALGTAEPDEPTVSSLAGLRLREAV